MMKTHPDRGQAPVSQGAHTSPYLAPKPVAAWTQRACPQIDNSYFQSNRAREQAYAQRSRHGHGVAMARRATESDEDANFPSPAQNRERKRAERAASSGEPTQMP